MSCQPLISCQDIVTKYETIKGVYECFFVFDFFSLCPSSYMEHETSSTKKKHLQRIGETLKEFQESKEMYASVKKGHLTQNLQKGL